MQLCYFCCSIKEHAEGEGRKQVEAGLLLLLFLLVEVQSKHINANGTN